MPSNRLHEEVLVRVTVYDELWMTGNDCGQLVSCEHRGHNSCVVSHPVPGVLRLEFFSFFLCRRCLDLKRGFQFSVSACRNRRSLGTVQVTQDKTRKARIRLCNLVGKRLQTCSDRPKDFLGSKFSATSRDMYSGGAAVFRVVHFVFLLFLCSLVFFSCRE